MADGYWFYAIILGAAFSTCARDLAEIVRENVRDKDHKIFWPFILWHVFSLLLVIEVFVAVTTAYRANPTSRSVLDFFAFLAVPVGIFVASTQIKPVSWKEREWMSDADAFARGRKAFFTIIFLIPLVNIIHEVILGEAGFDADLFFQVLLMVGAGLGFFLRSLRGDIVVAVGMILVIATYIGTQYSTIVF